MSPPLAGVGVLMTRPIGQTAGLRARLEELGARCFLFPTLEIQAPADSAALARRLADLAGYDLAIFVSPTAVSPRSAANIAIHGRSKTETSPQ